MIRMEYDVYTWLLITVESITHLHHFTFFHQRLTLTFQFIKLTLGNTNSISIQGHGLTPNIYLLYIPNNPKTITSWLQPSIPNIPNRKNLIFFLLSFKGWPVLHLYKLCWSETPSLKKVDANQRCPFWAQLKQ